MGQKLQGSRKASKGSEADKKHINSKNLGLKSKYKNEAGMKEAVCYIKAVEFRLSFSFC